MKMNDSYEDIIIYSIFEEAVERRSTEILDSFLSYERAPEKICFEQFSVSMLDLFIGI